MKGSQDSDFSLVSNKNLNKIFPSSGLGSGPGRQAKKALHYPTYDITHKKMKAKKFFFTAN